MSGDQTRTSPLEDKKNEKEGILDLARQNQKKKILESWADATVGNRKQIKSAEVLC